MSSLQLPEYINSFHTKSSQLDLTACVLCKCNFKNYKRCFADCQHDQKICYDCYIRYLERAMQNKENLTCPLCSKDMLLDSTILSTFYNHLSVTLKSNVKTYINQITSKVSIWTCQKTGCEGKINDQICAKCGQQYCPKCKQLDHVGKCAGFSNSTTTSNSLPQDEANIVKCPKCNYKNKTKKKSKKLKCQNKYCHFYVCTQHKIIWNKSHDQKHPQELNKEVGCALQCLIY